MLCAIIENLSQEANSKLDFQQLNKILINQVCFFDYILVIIFQSMKMLVQIVDLRLCALMLGFEVQLTTNALVWHAYFYLNHIK